MKTLFIYILLLLCSSVAIAQSYKPLPTSAVVWIDNENKHQPPNNYCRDNQYVITKDTTMNGMQYYQIHKYVVEYTNPSSCYPLNYTLSNQMVGYFRNDSLNKKVWYRLPNAATDTLLYDFDLQLNQNYPSTYLDPDTFMGTVSQIDSVQFNNKWHIRYEITGCPTYYLIEGVGSSLGFMSPPHCFDVSTTLKCMSIANTSIYPNSTAQCDIITNIIENTVEMRVFEPFPNPTSAKVFIENHSSIQRIEVYNLQGQKVQEIEPTKKSWELPHDPGMYLIRVQDREGFVFLGKVVKK